MQIHRQLPRLGPLSHKNARIRRADAPHHRNARFSSLFQQAEWLSMHNHVSEI